ncbi:MAG: AbrB family transcriptional regulator [Rhizobiaceae bacterium]|nr:AbrB family transcriptional regulator [Rhizobiaceae bacterium]MCV0407776.1 AbrB family transcriptional regulator [Rhizobiaceae bacterium]
MTDRDGSGGRPWSAGVQWLTLVLVSALIGALLHALAVPGALLIGPLLIAVLWGVRGATIRMPPTPSSFAQALIGCLIAASIEIETIGLFFGNWPVFLGAVLATVAASSLFGWMVSRWGALPGTTGVWGAAPGAASAMVLMADAFGADARLVAFMQYLRVIFVTLAAAAVARLFIDTSGSAAPTPWFPPIEWDAFGTTLAVALAGLVLGRLVRLPSPAFLGPMILGSLLHIGFGLQFQIPEWLLAVCYAAVGWTIGLKFDRTVLVHAWRALPHVVMSIVALMVFCGVLAWLLVVTMGVDPLTAYLATSPGGMDSIAIIAAASNSVNISFVITLQTARFVFVLLLGPAISRVVARTLKP